MWYYILTLEKNDLSNFKIRSNIYALKEENEENLSKILKSGRAELVPIDTEEFKDIILLPVTIPGTICVCPSELYEGFFIAKIKNKEDRYNQIISLLEISTFGIGSFFLSTFPFGVYGNLSNATK